jgi:hypothetical protein
MSFKQLGTEQFRIFGNHTENYLSFYNDQGTGHQLTLASDGNVGIGTTSPYDSAWGGNSKQLTISGGTYGVLNLIDAGGPTRFGIGAGDGKLYLAYDDVASAHRIVVSSSGNVGIGTDSPASSAKLTVMGNQTFGLPGNGTNTSGRFISIEGNTDSSGEGSGRIFFSEHNSTTAAMDNYGMSLGYRGGATSIVGASGNTWTGLTQIGNGEWGMWGHNNNATGSLIMFGNRAATYVSIPGNVGIGVTSPSSTLSLQNSQSTAANNTTTGSIFQAASPNSGIFMRNRGNSAGIGGTPYSTQLFTDAAAGNFEIYNNAATFNLVLGTNATERMRITSTGAISVGSSGTAYGAAGEVLTSNGNASPSWQAAGGGGSAWPQEKFAEYTINSTTSNILVATMNSTTWHGNYLSGCLKFTMSTSDYVQVTYVPVSTFLSGSSKWFFKGTEMTSKNNGSNPAQLVFTFAGDLGTFGSTCTLKINRNQSISNYIKVNVLVQAISNPNMFILN